MENVKLTNFVNELRRLNPNSKFKCSNYRLYGLIYSNTPANKLRLPQGYYFKSKTIITNQSNVRNSNECDYFDFEYDPEVFGEYPKKSFWERLLNI